MNSSGVRWTIVAGISVVFAQLLAPVSFGQLPSSRLGNRPVQRVTFLEAEAPVTSEPVDGSVDLAWIEETLDILEEEYPNLPFLWLDTEDSSGEVFVLTASELCAGNRTEGRNRPR